MKDIKIWAAYMMGFGSYSAWINAYILTASGHLDSGLADMRRATEFACYAAKVIKDEKRAWAWIEQQDDPKAQRLFASSCAIPLSYLSDDYKFLRPLMVYYDYASYYGTHANYASIIEKFEENEGEGLRHLFQSDPKRYASVAGTIMIMGFRLFTVFSEVLSPCIKDKKSFEELKNYIKSKFVSARCDLAEVKFGSPLPEDIVLNIYSDEQDSIDKLFFEIVEREKNKKNKTSV